MFLLCSLVKKVDVVIAKQKEDGDRIQEIRAELEKGSRSSKCKFHGPVSITSLQICADGTNNLTMHSSGTKRKRYENFQPGANAETDVKTSSPVAENDQGNNDTRMTDCDFDRSVKDDERWKMNLDNCHDSFGDDDPDVYRYATRGYEHDEDCHDLLDIDDGGNVRGLSNLSGIDLYNVGTFSHASDDSDLTNISGSPCSGQGTAMETFPEFDNASDICMETSEKPVLSVKVSSECVDSKSMPVGGTSLMLSDELRADVDRKTGETESDVNTSSQAWTASGTHATSGANLKNALSVQGRKWPTSFDPLFAVPETNSSIISDAYDDQTSPGKGKCVTVIQSGGTIFKGWIDGMKSKGPEGLSHAELTDSPRQWSERSLSSGPVVQTDDIQRARRSPYAMDPHCVQTGNSMEEPERTLTSSHSDLGQIACDQPEYERPSPSIAPYNEKAVQGMLKSGEPVLATVVAETDNGIKGPISATSSDYVSGIMSDSSKPDEKYANACSPGMKEHEESIGIALPASSEADDGVKDFKGSTFVPSFDHGMVSDRREGVEGTDHFISGDLLKAGSGMTPTKRVPSFSLSDDTKTGLDTKEYKEPVGATVSDIVKGDRDMNECEEFGSVALCGTTKPDSGMKLACEKPSSAIVSSSMKDGNGMKLQHEEPSCISSAGFVKASNGSRNHQRCMSATVSHTVSAKKNKKESEQFLSAFNIRAAQDGEGVSGMKRSLSTNCLDSSHIGCEN